MLSACSPEEPAPAFEEISAAAGLGVFRHLNGARGDWWFPETMGSGALFTDYDRDGDPDIVLAGGGTWDTDHARALWLFENDGTGRYTDVTEASGLAPISAYSMGIIAGDIDNDGDEDLYLTAVTRDYLLLNDNGRFRDVTQQANLDHFVGWTVAAVFFDANRDGWLDIFVGGYVDWTPATDLFCSPDGKTKNYCTPLEYTALEGRYFANRGDGTFEDQTQAVGLSGSGKTLGAVVLDVNQDNWPDLALANDTDPDQLYINQGDGTFVERGLITGMALDERGKARAGMGIDAGVVDSTGEMSLFVGNFSGEMTGVYRSTPAGYFEDRAAVSGIGTPSLPALTFGLVLLDTDLDGDLDLFAANGHVHPRVEEHTDGVTFEQRPQLFVNDGSGTFLDMASQLGLSEAMVGRAAAVADIDLDGDLDILTTVNNGPARLFRNNLGAGQSWLRVELTGTRSNQSAIDARVIVESGGLRQYRRIRAGGSYGSQSELPPTIGLGAAPHADSVIVIWPSGQVDRLGPVNANRTLALVEEGS